MPGMGDRLATCVVTLRVPFPAYHEQHACDDVRQPQHLKNDSQQADAQPPTWRFMVGNHFPPVGKKHFPENLPCRNRPRLLNPIPNGGGGGGGRFRASKTNPFPKDGIWI